KFITRQASERIARFAFEYAEQHQRRQVAVAHRADVLRITDGLFLSAAQREAARHPAVAFAELAIDNTCLQLVRDPTRFDIILAPLTYGDFLSDLCAGLAGGLGFMGGANYGDGVAIFEAAHGSAPRYAGQNTANPVAMILSAGMMLDHLGEPAAAGQVRQAVGQVLSEGSFPTREMGGTTGTREIAAAIADRVRQLAAQHAAVTT
ncbi:MAG: isocitrate dehydrogenase, partial [Actinomycetota bacterium]|nr:isocitrate dehydrogenase [Actinomycetota bacterium]